MNRPDFDNMTKKEQRQHKACFNEFLGRQLASQKRRKAIKIAMDKIEYGEETNKQESMNELFF